MSKNRFEEMPSYKIIDHLYDERKDFIILGLCGRVGSGVSTVSSILEKKFEELQLPNPGFEALDHLAAHEYRILHTYAKENWKAFYRIRTSALITRYILNYSIDDFLGFLTRFRGDQNADTLHRKLQDIVSEFFTNEMECDWEQYFRYHTETESSNIHNPWKLFASDGETDELIKAASNGDNEPTGMFSITIDEQQINFSYNSDKKVCSFKNEDLGRLLSIYASRRRNKSGFRNKFLYLVLQQYLYSFLPTEATSLWKKVSEISPSLPTQALQYMGNNLRMNRVPYFQGDALPLDIDKDGYVCLAEDINLAIKVLRAYQLVLHEKHKQNENMQTDSSRRRLEVRTVIVVDSIKNPYESLYLKARYSNYYLIGVYTEEDERKKRLREREHFVDDDIRAIDIIEENTKFKKEVKLYKKYLENKDEKMVCTTPAIIQTMYEQFEKREILSKLSYISPFILQNVSSCLDSADILINNITDNSSYTFLKKTLLRYVCLIMNPGIVLPTPVERCMQIAYTTKVNSGCISRQVGAVVTDSEYHLLSVGWNQQPEGQIPCSYRTLCELHHHWDTEGYSDYENNDDDRFQKGIAVQVESFFDTPNSPLHKKGKLPHYCFKDYENSINSERNQVHTRALHAEETAFLNLGSNKETISGGILFTTSSPCELCAKKAMYLGISKIFYVEAYAGVSQKHVLNIGKLERRPNLVLFTGAIGSAYTKLFTPLLPQKDEYEMWLGEKWDIDLYKKLKENGMVDSSEQEINKNE